MSRISLVASPSSCSAVWIRETEGEPRGSAQLCLTCSSRPVAVEQRQQARRAERERRALMCSPSPPPRAVVPEEGVNHCKEGVNHYEDGVNHCEDGVNHCAEG